MQMAARLEGLQDELYSVRKQATIDAATKIFNGAALDEQIERESGDPLRRTRLPDHSRHRPFPVGQRHLRASLW
jgi:hypothetical protein